MEGMMQTLYLDGGIPIQVEHVHQRGPNEPMVLETPNGFFFKNGEKVSDKFLTVMGLHKPAPEEIEFEKIYTSEKRAIDARKRKGGSEETHDVLEVDGGWAVTLKGAALESEAA